LDLCHPSIQNDLNAENEVETLYGALYPILNERMHQNAPITLLSCDNLRNNGDSFRQGLIDFVKAKNNEALLLWLSDHVATPNSMVDRITPKFDESTHARMKSHGQP
ncbi:mannitol dehydrogenase family protein, partial [Pseudomonas syringae]